MVLLIHKKPKLLDITKMVIRYEITNAIYEKKM